jgi:hypothetical protein
MTLSASPVIGVLAVSITLAFPNKKRYLVSIRHVEALVSTEVTSPSLREGREERAGRAITNACMFVG